MTIDDIEVHIVDVEKPVESIPAPEEYIYSLYKIYPNGFKFFVAYCRTLDDVELAVVRTNEKDHVAEPYTISYEAREILRGTIPEWKIEDVVRRNKEEAVRRAETDRLYKIRLAEHERRVAEYNQKLAEWKEKHPGCERPLIEGQFPPLLPAFLLPPFLSAPEGIQHALRYLYDDDQPKCKSSIRNKAKHRRKRHGR